jgi:hypothetical protein
LLFGIPVKRGADKGVALVELGERRPRRRPHDRNHVQGPGPEDRTLSVLERVEVASCVGLCQNSVGVISGSAAVLVDQAA